MMSAGQLNAWFCPKCRGLTIVRHADAGVTPMFLGCRANADEPCMERAHSLMYPEPLFGLLMVRGASPIGDGPDAIEVEWEWFAETDEQREGRECLSLRRVPE